MSQEKVDFYPLLEQLNKRAARAVVSQLNFRNETVNGYLDKRFSEDWGKSGSFLADPVLEATFGWKAADLRMTDLSGDLLSKSLIHALDNPPKELASEYKFEQTWNPYQHQLDAWKTLLAYDWKSILVSSGTGSGKTECFLVPVLEDLARQLAGQSEPIVGVNALMLYPLNALINSQRQRLLAWTHQFKGNIRFCLYNGNTPRTVKSSDQHKTPNEVLSRNGLWESPPPILVTNSTMLEYMLVRNADRPILEQSQGKLRWIILDEAHTYIGSQAAELALLLRRVIQAFGVNSSDVRFVATSATIGRDDEEGNRKLAKFIADVAGVSTEQVKVVRGYRDIPALGRKITDRSDLIEKIPQLAELGSDELYQRFSENELSVSLRETVSQQPIKLSRLTQLLREKRSTITPGETLQYIDQLTRAKDDNGNVFLPMRGHIFERTLGGLWACSNKKCNGREVQGVDKDNWYFGAIYLHHQSYCSHCDAPVYELASCSDCGTEYLLARETVVDNKPKLLPTIPYSGVDEFVLDIELEEELSEEIDSGLLNRRLISPHAANRKDIIEKSTCDIASQTSDNTIEVDIVLPDPSGEGDSGLKCVNCGANEKRIGEKFRFKKLGAPTFLADILPTVLENSPPAEAKQQNNPSQGRRLLTFTDSRQGTARIASRLQQDADRNIIRTGVYQSLATPEASDDQTDYSELESHIAELEKQLDTMPDLVKGAIQDKINALKSEIDAGSDSAVSKITWHDMAEHLSKDQSIGIWMLDEFKRITGASLSPYQFADFCLFKEFARRPIRVNQAETLGLVQMHYEPLDKITNMPDHWASLGGSLEDWVDFLYLIVDYYIRANTATYIPDSPIRYSRWMGARVYPKFLQGPGSERVGRRYQRWPKARSKGSVSRLVNLLCIAFNRDITEADDRNIINHFLDQAWIAIRPLLKEFQEGYQLDLPSHVSFSSPRNAWRCPYSLRILPKAFRKLSPYLPLKSQKIDYCEPVELPILPFKYWRDERGTRISPEQITEWVETNPQIQTLRQKWLWPNRSDRVAYGESWYAIGEHSAQQPSPRLKDLEKKFKNGRVNILSCSTTMEMGVDIGGMSAVAMNNVPPSQANYLQRAGRAGRRKEATSVSITVCNNNAHGQQVFQNPLWPFDEDAITAPFVRLSSETIVQRHVNAYLLSEWLKQFDDDVPKLEAGWFFLDRNGVESRAADFINWCEGFRSNPSTSIQAAINAIVAKSSLEGHSLSELGSICAKMIRTISDSWLLEYDVLEQEYQSIQAKSKNADQLPAVKSLGYQMRRLSGEYLLKDLTSRGFLPGHGFPVGIVSMLTTTIQDLQRNASGSDREDNGFTSVKGATRESKVAIREYAPGAEFVADGKVYESSGITLNWHVPADAEGASEIQDLRWHWFCKNCGAGGTSINKTAVCNSCGDTKLRTNEILQPAGFAVDIRYEPHNDINTPKYLPYNDPRVQIGESYWQTFPDARLGRYRSSEYGSVLHWNAGQNNNGYSVCLYCGRAAEQEAPGQLPHILAGEHRRLRGGKDKDGSTVCDGSYHDFAIKKDLWLTAESTTSVVELQLLDPETAEPITEEGLAWSIGFALRHGLVTSLGIDSQEVSVAVQHFKDVALGGLYAIFLYDTTDMGAGYVEQLPLMLESTVKNALHLLDCHQQCDTACHSCLLGWDSQHRVDLLDRNPAKTWLDRWFKSLSLPVSSQYFGKRSRAELRSIAEALRSTRYQSSTQVAWVFIDGDVSEWDLTGWNLLNDIQYWAGEGMTVNIVIPAAHVSDLADAQKRVLSALQELFAGKIQIHSMDSVNQVAKIAKIIAMVEGDSKATLWASEEAVLMPGEAWGSSENVIVRGEMDKLNLPTKILLGEDLLPASIDAENMAMVNIRSELDGSISNFGHRLWNTLTAQSPVLKNQLSSSKITKIDYRDRYIASPIHAALLFSIFEALKDKLSNEIQVEISSVEVSEPRYPPSKFRDNWSISVQRDEVMRGVLEELINKKVHFNVYKKKDIEHRRALTLTWDDGKETTIWLDEGVGAWRASYQSFDFTVGVNNQIRQVKRAQFSVNIANSRVGTWILVSNN